MQWPCMKRDNDRSTKKDCSWSVIEKHAVLTEVRGFGDPNFDKTRCLQIIKKLLYLLNQGEIFTKSEAAAILSSAVNLYRFQDVHLRRMFHLIARDLCPIADEVSLVTSSLLNDVNTGNAAYRANAIRLLYHITNDTSLNKVVRFLNEALCDNNPTLQIASLVCVINLVKRDPRMAITLGQVYPESTVFDKGKHVQFHAIYLEFVSMQMGEVRRQKYYYLIWEKLSRLSSWCSSPLGACILICGIRQAARARRIWAGDAIHKYLLSCINGKDKMVAIEGFRSLEGAVGIGSIQLKDDIDVMRRILRSRKPVLRFSAFRALQKVGIVHNVVWTTPKDHTLIGLDVNLRKLYMEEVKHRDNEAEAEQISQVIKSQSFALKEASNSPLKPLE
ncbi:coatomer subunit gamma-like isoform X1 [Salvia divinorum]|uniref:Coatomer subunit gamma-like isoform X1 n=1 Tax=Salvia divinorum TaxID=28513 RepID=A0ABD1IHL5_SALDI